MLNPVAVKIATNYLPIGAADQCGKVTYGIPVTGDEDQFIGRVDFVQNAKHTLFGRYFVDAFKNPPTYDGKNLLTTTQAGNLERAQSVTIGDTYTFGPGTLNSFHFTFNRRRDDRGPTDIPINPTLLGVNMYSAVPNFLLFSVTGGFSTFCGTCAPGHFNVNSYPGGRRRGRDPRAASDGVRVQPRARAEQHHLRLPGEWKLHVQRHRERAIGLADFMIGRAERLQSNQRHSRRPAAVDHEFLCAGHLQDLIPVHAELRRSLGADVLRPG